ncbi:hypothetical protein MPDQ_005415 [Monascus purpureus]|uniref:Uncharacterized protein n=1 Tax=Monascus purpureus TaxID=5098 RepID=A0A507QKM4_MONPU|nr:hypothetical protein MPDQ_005415 [Monascus purpureus]
MDSKRGGLPESSDTSGHVSAVRSSETVRRPVVAGRSSRSYGTLESSDVGSEQLRAEDEQPESSSRAFVSQSASSQIGRPRKPSLPRRVSYKRQGPHKGQEFSTDDGLKEIEEDIAMQQTANPQPSPRIPQPSPRLHPLKNPSFSLRRRSNVRPYTLSEEDPDYADDDETNLPDPGIEAFGAQSSSLQSQGNDQEEDGHSDAESFTLKDRQQAINETHPFGIRIWKPALYKKRRSVEKTAEGDIHSSPGGRVSNMLFLFNLLWSLFFGWWLALAALTGAVACFIFAYSPSAAAYGRVFLGISWYIFYPFGSFVRLETDEHYAEEDEGEGRSISEYEQWQNGDLEHGRLFFGPRSSRSLVGRRRNSIDSASEHDSLLGRTRRDNRQDSSLTHSKRRLFGRGEWTLGRVVFFVFFYFLVGPLMLLVSLTCWMLVFWIPMGRVTIILFDHLRRHPLALSFHSDTAYTRFSSGSSSSVLLCTYRAAGTRYWKYTVDGTNIFFINLLGIVLFVIFDYWFLDETLGLHAWFTHPGLIFTLALFSIIPLAYFIGQAVASISAQSSMGMGAVVNAFFSTIVEVYLYCVALTEGLSMCFGAIKRKTQRFNVKSAGVTSTMLLFAMIAAFGPTLFYQIYGSHELKCRPCNVPVELAGPDCRRCYFSQVPAVDDTFFQKAVQPYSWFAALFLFLSYMIGLWFTLRTHAALIWATEIEEKKVANALQATGPYEPRHLLFQHGSQNVTGAEYNHKGSIRESQLYKRILGQSLNQVGLASSSADNAWGQTEGNSEADSTTLHVVPPPPESNNDDTGLKDNNKLSKDENERLVRHVTEVAATVAAMAAREGTQGRKSPTQELPNQGSNSKAFAQQANVVPEENDDVGFSAHPGGGGHDAPNWGRTKSSVILLVATLLYAIIAEILVNTVDVVLESVDIDEKFLGITLFALVPNTTEFLNAISFAMNGNIALSMEIGSAYALQVCLLQIPALVLFSAVYSRLIEPSELLAHTFNLIFPQWDMVTVILCVFLLSYVYGEGKSNYFKGSILVLTYLVVVIGFYLSGYNTMDIMGVDRFDTLALGPEKSYLAGSPGDAVTFESHSSAL